MYEAIKSFSGVISMSCGEVAEINDDYIAKDLLRAGYIREVKPATKGKAEEAKEEPKAEPKAEKKPTRAKAKKG